MMIKRKIDQLLAQSNGMQLVWLMAVSALCLGVALAMAYFVYDDAEVRWQTVVAIFLDPGCFGGVTGHHDLFRLVIALLSIFLFSALLVSVFSNLFENIREAAQNGERRYRLSGHVLVFGSGRRLSSIVRAINESGRTAVVMASAKPDLDLGGTPGCIFYRGRRDVEADVLSARPERAQAIYIIGEEDEPSHDDRSLACLDILGRATARADHDIHCYLTLRDYTSTEVFQYLKTRPEGRLLLVDTVNEHEYTAEQLLVGAANTFTPVLRSGDTRRAHFVIIGTGPVAQAVAYTAAHICHYPGYLERGLRTRITFIAPGMERWRDHLMASRPALFSLCHTRFVRADGTAEDSVPQGGDFIDVEWQFVDGEATSPVARAVMESQADSATRIVVCHSDASLAVSDTLHLPRKVYGIAPVAVYMPDGSNILDRAAATGMYGHIELFGQVGEAQSDPLFSRRSSCGQRVNFVYHRAYASHRLPTPEAAWFTISEADKYSSIFCANAMPLRRQCFDMEGDRRPIYEAEHRRWMMSELIMGFAPAPQTDKRRFLHADIVPFDDLTPEEQEKDKILIDAMDYVIGEGYENSVKNKDSRTNIGTRSLC